MKIKKLIAMKEECENKIECLELALGYANIEGELIDTMTTKITLTPEQAQDITFANTSLTRQDDDGVLNKETLYLFQVTLS